MNKSRIISLLAGLTLVVMAGLGSIYWLTFRVYVPEDKCMVLIRKMGKALPAGQDVATEPGFKGIQPDVLGPGRYFYNPLRWDWKLEPLTEIPAGKPGTWEWTHSLNAAQREQLRLGTFKFKGEFPQIGVVTRKVGPKPKSGRLIVDRASGQQGILREVLTPGTYKINPYIYEVKLHPAIVIPAGFVGVVTNLFGDLSPVADTSDDSGAHSGTAPSAPAVVHVADLPEGSAGAVGKAGSADAKDTNDATMTLSSNVRPLSQVGDRGTLRNILQPGVYFINPKLQKVTLIEIGYNEYSQTKVSDVDNMSISFPSDTGYLISVGVTVVWGIHPKHAAQIINEFGNIDRVLDKVIGPQLRSICRNIGSTYAARDFIHGQKREMFQRALTAELQRVCRTKNIEIRIALVREIEVHAPGAKRKDGEATDDLKRTIQQSYVAKEKQLTKGKQREAAAVRAELEEQRKKVDIARETIRAESRVMVANVKAEGQKQAAQIDAQADLEVATIQQEVALLDAKRTEMLGAANADVEKMKNEAEAQGYEMLVNAFGSGQAYNLYTFAEGFQPESVRLFFAGDGTFWTDLTRFEELGAAKVLEPKENAKAKIVRD